MIIKINILFGGKKAPTVEQLRAMVAEIDLAVSEARQDLDAMHQANDAVVLACMSRGDAAALERRHSELALRERRLAELVAARNTACDCLQEAEAAASDAAERVRWDHARELVQQRNATGIRLQGLLNEAASRRAVRKSFPLIVFNFLRYERGGQR
ncbi:MAG: hypothetical protein HQM00_14350 [Magnetococcales bacterium]|nr:hypothetical protein [Magnetococcales bacterium]